MGLFRCSGRLSPTCSRGRWRRGSAPSATTFRFVPCLVRFGDDEDRRATAPVRLFSWYTALRETPNPREKTSQIPIPDHTGFIPLSTRTFLKKGVKFSCAGASGRVAGAMGKKRTASDDATESARKKKKGGRPLTPAVFASPATANKTRDKPV